MTALLRGGRRRPAAFSPHPLISHARPYGELLEARCWAINLAKNYAADEGITFVLLNDEHDPNK